MMAAGTAYPPPQAMPGSSPSSSAGAMQQGHRPMLPSQAQQYQQQQQQQQHRGPPPQRHQRPPPQQQQQQQHFRPQQQQQQQQQQQSPAAPAVPLTLRLILTRDEVNYLFGFDGLLLDQLHQQTGAAIALSEANSREQVCSIAGGLELIFKAFSLICRKLWDFISNLPGGPPGGGAPRPLVVRLAVPASQCGSIIGKHGAKVNEIKHLTGANVQVGQESLPDSTERCVEISGTGEACLQCAYHVCCVLQEAPLRGDVVPYAPKPSMGSAASAASEPGWKPVFLCGEKAFVIEGDLAVPAPPELLRRELAKTHMAADAVEAVVNGGGVKLNGAANV